ncbi:MAG: hypothetical protein HY094_05050 [Candidatus Melainabacteria bacterium]|nr:hypothetical protein [Candidatus Melainabacteria bacterium]
MDEDQNKFFDEIIAKIQNIQGTDYIYFLGNDYQIIKEQKVNGSNNYLEQILNIVKSEPRFEEIGTNLYSKPFHTYTLLNETGLIVISKLQAKENLYLVIIAGENKSVDLINLLKTCKESRLGYQALLNTNV